MSTTSAPVHELERVRIASAVSSRVGFSALGEADLLDAAAEAHGAKWTAGEALDDSWSQLEHTAVLSSEGGRELRVAVRVSDSEAALAGVRALQDEEHP